MDSSLLDSTELTREIQNLGSQEETKDQTNTEVQKSSICN